nr:hypothetical protein [uncultured Anaerocolumna sp.]
MKRYFKTLVAIVCAVVLFAAPSTALAALSSEPNLVVNEGGLKIFYFEPEAYYLQGGYTKFLKDTTSSDGYWLVPAGNESIFNCYLTDTAYFRVKVASKSDGIVYDSGVINEFTDHIVFPAKITDQQYLIIVEAYTDINIMGYDGYFYNN